MSGGLTVRRGNPRGIELRPGAVAQARAEAGLSLEALGGGELSRAAVHLIEHGKSRPSVRSLQLIAERTGKPVSFFLPAGAELPSAKDNELGYLLELERLAASSDFTEVLARAHSLAGVRSPYLQARVHLACARAATILGDGERGIDEAQRAHACSSQAGEPVLQVDALAWRGAALHVLHDPGALEELQGALSKCRQLPTQHPDLEARILTNIALIQVGRQRWDDARDSFDAALRAAEGIRDLARMARMYDGLALAYEARGSLGRAAESAQRALGLYEMANNRAGEARMRTEYADLLRRRGDVAAAKQQVDLAFEALSFSGIQAGTSRLFAVAAAVSAGIGDHEAADRYARSAAEVAEREGDHAALSEVKRVQARIAAASGDLAAVRLAFDAAVRILPPDTSTAARGELLAEYAAIVETLGDTRHASELWRSAALVQNPSVTRIAPVQPAREASAG